MTPDITISQGSESRGPTTTTQPPTRRRRPMSPNPETHDPVPEMVEFFKALADPARLRIVGLLAEESRCGRELATELGLSPATVTHHLRGLKKVGLVHEDRQPPYTYFKLDLGRMQSVLRNTIKKDQVKELAVRPDVSQEENKVLSNFFQGDTLKSIPAQRRKKEIIFEELLRRLPEDKPWPERELSAWLKGFHSDFCTIRREFIMCGYMERAKGVYELTSRGRAVREA